MPPYAVFLVGPSKVPELVKGFEWANDAVEFAAAQNSTVAEAFQGKWVYKVVHMTEMVVG